MPAGPGFMTFFRPKPGLQKAKSRLFFVFNRLKHYIIRGEQMFDQSVIDTENLIEGLNEYQKEVVNHQNGVVRVNATAGSGKTTSITKRIAMMRHNGVDPNSILLTTFTKQAAKEMSTRLSRLVSRHDLECLTIGTIHSTCYKILRDSMLQIQHPYSSIFAKNGNDIFLMNEEQRFFSEKILQTMTRDLKGRYDFNSAEEWGVLSNSQLASFMGVVAHSKNNAMTHEQYASSIDKKNAFQRLSSKFYTIYEERKLAEGKVDMGDILMFTYEIFNDYPEILHKYQTKFKYIITDESQDQNHIQNKLVKMIAAPHNNICIVGDVSQAIFGFQGGKPEEFLSFIDEYPNATQLHLPINYRSKSHIVDVANKLIKHNTLRIEQDALAFKQTDDKCVSHHSFPNEQSQSQFVATKIHGLLKEGVEYKDIAVLYRTNAQSRSVEEIFMEQDIPYTLHSSYGFYDRKEIAEILAYLRLVKDRNDDVSFQRVINKPNRYLGKRFINALNEFKESNWDAINLATNLEKYEQNSAREFKRSVDSLARVIEEEGVAEGIGFILHKIGYQKTVNNLKNFDERMENINVLISISKKFNDVKKFLSYIDLLATKKKETKNSVQMMSIHKSKGLEYEYVFIIGMNEGLLPHNKALETEDLKMIEEERRLAYVAITRAINRLYLCSTSSYADQIMEESRFIKEAGF
ncbi:3'-5' exonuclease [Shouchella clausii]|uniref:ATP-dependent helicase n=1 Tax=Shouchella clausii TaxID=79880 RepID=UPI002DB59436|nr:UvrD-helicase domain-containing protein [Shouchella clausii]MEB5480827.1 3'-5' exonuclease [Shouchella clausii]